MLFYILFLIITLSLVFVINTVVGTDTALMCLLYTFISFVFEFVLDAIIATLLRHVMIKESWIKPGKGIFKIYKFERRLYERLGIKHWKDKVPELGQATAFRKNKLVDPKSPEYLHRFIIESCYGELIHFQSCVWSFLLLFLGFIKPNMLWPLFLPCCFINLFLNLLPALIQRYVRPRLEVLYERALRAQERNKESV